MNSCPFCDCIPDMLKRIIPNSDQKEILYQLHKHVAVHLKDLAILSIPILDATDAPEDIDDPKVRPPLDVKETSTIH
nr:hypothetical protein [Trichoderma atroviride]